MIIYQSTLGNFIYAVNIETPSSKEELKKLFSYIENDNIKVIVNTAYPNVKKSYENNNIMIRLGYDFKFWFDNNQTAENFSKLFNGNLEIINKEEIKSDR